MSARSTSRLIATLVQAETACARVARKALFDAATSVLHYQVPGLRIGRHFLDRSVRIENDLEFGKA